MIIGQFIRTTEGNFTGSITAIGAILPKVTFEAVTSRNNGPDFVGIAQGSEIGAGWNKMSERTRNPYVSVSLKSPFLPAQVYCALVDADEPGRFNLVWSEPKAKSAD